MNARETPPSVGYPQFHPGRDGKILSMSSTQFVHLRLHSEFSVVDGIVRIDDAIAKAAADGQGALALTDSANMFGAVRFYSSARKRGIKPIIGCDLWITNDLDRDSPTRMAVLVQGRAGYLNLCELITRAYLENPHRNRAEVRIEWFEESEGRSAQGLIALSGARYGTVGTSLLAGKPEAATLAAQRLASVFHDRFYLELQRTGDARDAAQARAALSLATRLKLPVVATHPIQFLERADFRAHEARVCIAEGHTLNDTRRPRRYTAEQYFKTQAEMAELFADVPVALANSVQIAKRCNLTLELGTARLPRFPTPDGVTLDDHCRALACSGLEQRLTKRYADERARNERRPEYEARLDLELSTIAKMGYSGYFLIVADFINWAKGNGIPVGPGRGSGAGSLVAYSLRITDLDPLQYGLLFERFLNPERVSMPDFDIDFCQDNRDRVIDYVKRKYGHDAVSQIATFGTLGAKAVVRDAGRVLDMPYTKCDQLSKLIPHNPTDPWTLDRALAQEPAFADAVAADEENQELIALARPLEGLTRNVGMHAGGVLIAPGRLTDFTPLYCAQGTEGVISQYDKDDVEAIGLVKFDFLGLTTLTILDLTLQYVRQLDPSFALELDTLPLDDAATYEIFKRGATTAIFQFESRGMRELLKRARPDRLEDLIALNALYRPGPMDLIPEYVDRKQGRQKVEYLHRSIEPILSETYGVMVYQEQVMRIAQIIGGYSLGAADLLRRAMSKKKPEEMATHRSIFVEGAAAKGVDARTATELFNHIEKFAGYGFNKCVIGATVVSDAVTGKRHTVRELFENRGRSTVHLHALGSDWKLRARMVRDVVWNGRRATLEVRTALGKRLIATSNHPLRTLGGWKEIADLAPGDRIAVPRLTSVGCSASWPDHELIVLGGLLSEGNTCHPTCLYYFNNDEQLIADFTRAVSMFPCTVARVTTRADRRFEVCVSTGRDTRFRRGQRPWNATVARTEGNTALAVDDAPRRSGAFVWAQSLGLLDVRADQKRVPNQAFELSDDAIALLLGRMWSGDGFFIGRSNTVPFYATSSPQLARDVQELLLRLGIVSCLQQKRFNYRGSTRPGYAIFLIGDSVRRFVQRVLPHCVGREKQVAALTARMALIRADSSSKDTIPAEVRQRVDLLRHSHGGGAMTWRELEEECAVSTKEFLGRGGASKRGFRRSTIARFGQHFGDSELLALAESDVYWDTVVGIEPHDVEDVYDLEIEGDHNFVAEGLIVHNSHSAAYALVAYQTAYFKVHTPAAFMAANLSTLMDDTDKVKDLIEDCEAIGLKVLPPDVNASAYRFEPVDPKTIRYGLGAIKGTGRGAIEAIISARSAGGPFADLFDLTARVDKQFVSRRVVEALVRSGAFDRLNSDRAVLLASVGRAIDAADSAAAAVGQASLFGAFESNARHVEYVPAARWSESEKLSNEKLALGYYFSGHLFTEFASEARRLAPTPLAEVRQAPIGRSEQVKLAGVIVSARSQNTRRGRMGIVVLEDGTAQLELMVFSELYDRKRALLKEDQLLFVIGRVRNDEFAQRLSVSADDLMDLTEARARAAARLRIEVEGAGDVSRLRDALNPYRVSNGHAGSGCRIVISYRNGAGSADVALPDEWRVRPEDRLAADLAMQPKVRRAYYL